MLYRALHNVLKLTLILSVFVYANTEAVLYFVTEENAVNSDNFILDFDDSSSDFIDLEFGTSLGTKLSYDILNTKFIFNRDLDLGGNSLMDMKVESLAVAPTCDATSVGRFYFNTTTDKTYICDGVLFNMLENEGSITVQFPAVQARRTTPYTLTTAYTDITLDTTDLENSVAVLEHDTVNTDRILIKDSGLFQIIYSFTPGGTASSTHEAAGQVRVNDATVLEGSTSVNKNYQSEYSTTSSSFLTSLNAGDFVSLQLKRDATADDTQGDIFFSIVKIEGIKGDKGDPGATGPAGVDGVDGANGDITWMGNWVSQNYQRNQAVYYQGSSYVCILDTVSIEIPTNTTYWGLLAAQGDPGVAEDMLVARYRDSSTTDLNVTATDNIVPWDTEDIEDGAAFSHDTVANNSQIQVLTDGKYLVSGAIDVANSSTNNFRYNGRVKFRVNGTTVLPMRFQSGYIRQTSGQTETSLVFSTVLDLSENDYFEILIDRENTTAGVANMISGQSSLSVVQLKGPKGENGTNGVDGVNGIDGTNGADGDIVWQGTWVSQNYIVHDTVEYLGSTYICILNTVASEMPTDPTYWDLVAAKGDQGPQGLPGSIGTGTNGETFTIDTDDTGGDLALVFGQTLNERLTWNNTQSRFDMSDALNVFEDLTVGGVTETIDTDGGEFILTGDDVFIADSLGVEGAIYTDDTSTKYQFIDIVGCIRGSAIAGTVAGGNSPVIRFDDSGDSNMRCVFPVPDDWVAGTDINIEVMWSPEDNGSGDIDFDLLYSSYGVGDTIASGDFIDTISGATYETVNANTELDLYQFVGAIVAADLNEKEIVNINLGRTPGDAGDTYDADINIHMLRISYTGKKLH